MSPAIPMVMNIQRQPRCSIRIVSSGAAIAVPRLLEQFQMPVARPRSRGANQSATMRAQLGNWGDSPTPSKPRHHGPGRQLAKGIYQKKCREQHTAVGNGNSQLLTDQRQTNGQAGSVNVIDDAAENEKRQCYPLDPPDANG